MYLVPMILIVWTIDIFFSFVQCPLHPEYSAPCSIIWINAIGYIIFFIIAAIFAVFSAKKLKKVKRRIEDDFLEATSHTDEINEALDKWWEEVKKDVKKKDIKKVNKKQSTKKVVKNEAKKSTKASVKKKVS